jgi:histidyl-tRNA synthetase
MERLALLLGDSPTAKTPKESPLIYFISQGEETIKKSIELIEILRDKEIRVISDLGNENLKQPMKKADRIGSNFAVILGPNELKNESVEVKELATAEQNSVGFAQLPEHIKKLGGD